MEMTVDQKNKFVKLLSYLGKNNEYFKNIVPQNISEFSSKELYINLPITTKKDIIDKMCTYYDKSFINCFKSDADFFEILTNTHSLTENHDKQVEINGINWYIEMTSGTSGQPLPIIKNLNEKIIEARNLNICRRKMFSNASLENGFLLVHKIDEYLKQIDCRGNNYHSFNKIFNYMMEKKPEWIFSTTLILNQFVNFLIYQNYEVSSLKIKFIETTSQKLYKEDKEKIYNLFKCNFSNNYGCREVWNIAYSCPCGRMHINSSNLFVDLIDDNGNIISEQGREGNIILTSLSNYITPFVKYLIGDRGKIYYINCECGLKTPIIELCDGREIEKICGTEFYGSVIFRKVLRTLNFHHNIKDIIKIKIIQIKSNFFNVYVKKSKINDLYFEKMFKENFEFQIGRKDMFSFYFIYDYPFSDDGLKELIFLNRSDKYL